MFGIFFYVIMLLALIGGGFAYKGNWPIIGHGFLMWLAVLLLGLHTFPFRG